MAPPWLAFVTNSEICRCDTAKEMSLYQSCEEAAPGWNTPREFRGVIRGLLSITLSRNPRTTDSPSAAESAEFLFRFVPRTAACALLRVSK